MDLAVTTRSNICWGSRDLSLVKTVAQQYLDKRLLCFDITSDIDLNCLAVCRILGMESSQAITVRRKGCQPFH